MTNFDLKRLALILAVQAEIEGMKAKNEDRMQFNDRLTYLDLDFELKAKELREIASQITEDSEVKITCDGKILHQRIITREALKKLTEKGSTRDLS